MTRDETIARFLECEAKRAEARKAALDQGKSENEAETLAHDAAKRRWNQWAEPLLAERKAMEAEGRWDSGKADWTARAAFSGGASFESTAFSGVASFASAAFSGRALFASAAFSGIALFDSAAFSGNARFDSAAFSGDARFDRAAFSGHALFDSAAFSGDARFDIAAFSGEARFDSAAFSSDASFESAAFKGRARFYRAAFSGDARFQGQTFTKDVFFNKARFGPGRANFGLATFERVVQFDGAAFTGEADFNAVSGKRTFSMSGAKFAGAPNFIQAHFEEAPRLDNVVVTPTRNSKLLSADEALDLFARWRELKRLAIQAHDTDRELEFNAQEIRAERAASRWPIPNKAHGWKIWLRLLFGWLYGVFSNYGRSLVRPLAAWAIGILAFAAFYLSQTEVLQRDLALQNSWAIGAAVQAGGYGLLNRVPCYPPPLTPAEDWRKRWRWRGEPLADPNQTRVDGLSAKLRSQTNARAEALHLAFRNAFVVLDGGSDASHRMYGCLYGLELYAGQNPVPIVPSAVSTASAIQKLISGVLIFLFGLALRNMLKVK